jgi:hypothetical protein
VTPYTQRKESFDNNMNTKNKPAPEIVKANSELSPEARIAKSKELL